jgi:hypothetical protein
MYLAKNGGGSGSISLTLGISNALGIASMVAGIGAIYAAWAAQSAKEVALEAAKKAAVDAVESGASQAVIDSTAQALGKAFEVATEHSIGSIIASAVSEAANFAGKVGLIHGDVATYTGLAAGSVDSITTSFQSATEATIDSVINNIKEGVTQFVSKPLSEIMNQVVNWMNMGFNIYMKTVDPGNEGLADKQAQLEKSNKEVETTTPEAMSNVYSMYTDPYGSIFEVGDIFDKTCILMCQGKNRSLMDKCYDSGYMA